MRWYSGDKLMGREGTTMTEEIKKVNKKLNAIEKEIEEVKKKQLDTEDPYKPTGKSKKARHRLKAIDEEIEEIKKQLDNARVTLLCIIAKQAFSKIKGIDEQESKKILEELKTNDIINKNGINLTKFKPDNKTFTLNLTPENEKFEQDIINILRVLSRQKKRSMAAIAPERIEFDFNSLKFYIDFTVVASEHDEITDIKGSIVYGTSRTLCFLNCIFPNRGTDDDCKNCERIRRCDGLEDKPLISFEVSQHGMIQSSGKLEGEWWIKDKPDLDELHYRAIDLIWKEALDWANEIILP